MKALLVILSLFLYPQDKASQPPGVLTGRVVDDDGRPMRGMQVVALSMVYVNGKRQMLPQGNPATTNDRGEFRLFWLEPGAYFVLVNPNPTPDLDALFRGPTPVGYIPTDPDATFVTTYFPGTWDFRKAELITVAAGETDVHAIQAATLPSQTIRVRIVNSKLQVGTFVPLFILEPPKDSSLPPSPAKTARALGNNEYELRTGLLPGEYRLLAQIYSFDGSYGGSAAINVNVENRDTVDLLVERTMRVQGQIVTEGALTPLRVFAVPDPSHDSAFPIASDVRPNGRFVLEDITPGAYALHVDGLENDAYISIIELGDKELPGQSVEFVSNSEPDTLKLTMKQDGASVTGIVIDKTGTAQAGASVVLIPAGELRDHPHLFRFVSATAQGEFQFRAVVPGKYLAVALPRTDPELTQDEHSLKEIERYATPITVGSKSRISIGALPLAKRVQANQ
jgi:hypothetical protein